MTIPQAFATYANTSIGERRMLQEVILLWWFEDIANAHNFGEVFAAMSSKSAALVAERYPTHLLDENAESMVAYHAVISARESVTVTALWDEVTGPSISCLFEGTEKVRVLAKDRTPEIVDISPQVPT